MLRSIFVLVFKCLLVRGEGATSPSCTNAFGIVCTVGLQACGTFDQEVWNGVEVL